MYKAILWDIDGTLLNFDMALSAAIKDCFQRCGLGECSDRMTRRYAEINEGYWKMLERGEITRQELFVRRFENFFAEYGINYSTTEFDRLYKLSLREQVFFNDNSYDLVRSLRGKVKQFAVSNTPAAELNAKLKKSGLDLLFEGIFISEYIGYVKPSPQFFDKVFDAVPEISREQSIIVGDSLTSDMKGGNNAGIACCWYNPEHKPAPSGLRIDYMISDLNEIVSII